MTVIFLTIVDCPYEVKHATSSESYTNTYCSLQLGYLQSTSIGDAYRMFNGIDKGKDYRCISLMLEIPLLNV